MLNIILNAKAGVGRGGRFFKEIEPQLKDIDYKLYKTKHDGHAMSIAKEITASAPADTKLIVMGGDGTLNEVITGIENLEKVTIGYIPVGSGNDFARGMWFEPDPQEMLKKILNPQEIKAVDVGYITYGDDNKKRRFIISSGFGWEATICHRANLDSRIKKALNKIGLGKLTYMALAVKVLAGYPRYKVKLHSDNGDYEFDNVLFTTAMNLPYEGGGFKFRPDASYNSGKLHMIIAHDMNYIQTAGVLIKGLKGTHVKHVDKIGTFDAKSIVLESNRNMDIHVDGQPILARHRIEYHMETSRLKFIV